MAFVRLFIRRPFILLMNRAAGSGKSVVSYANPAHAGDVVDPVIGPQLLMIYWNYANRTLIAQSHFFTLISMIHRSRNAKVLYVQ